MSMWWNIKECYSCENDKCLWQFMELEEETFLQTEFYEWISKRYRLSDDSETSAVEFFFVDSLMSIDDWFYPEIIAKGSCFKLVHKNAIMKFLNEVISGRGDNFCSDVKKIHLMCIIKF